MPWRKDISLNDTGLILSNLAKSTNAITAYLPLDVNFILPLYNRAFYTYLTKMVKYSFKKKVNILSLSCDKRNFF